ncbi:MAG: hypothetical protein AB7O39_06345 [Flavobacteriaceae bacterium]|nr:hypothetical protein [Rhodobiaceae bacterium]MCC0054686.1 hypothetical protein [Rhodobiaceae bacterium]
MKDEKDHWLVRPETIRKLWILLIVICAATVLGDLFVEHHAHFGIEATIGFGAWFGFGSCLILVFAAKALGIFLKRKDSYYD